MTPIAIEAIREAQRAKLIEKGNRGCSSSKPTTSEQLKQITRQLDRTVNSRKVGRSSTLSLPASHLLILSSLSSHLPHSPASASLNSMATSTSAPISTQDTQSATTTTVEAVSILLPFPWRLRLPTRIHSPPFLSTFLKREGH